MTFFYVILILSLWELPTKSLNDSVREINVFQMHNTGFTIESNRVERYRNKLETVGKSINKDDTKQFLFNGFLFPSLPISFSVFQLISIICF